MRQPNRATMSSTPAPAGNPTAANPSEVGWQFVPQYYTFVNKHPNRLHCFYTKASTFLHGTEGEETTLCQGQQVSTLSLLPDFTRFFCWDHGSMESQRCEGARAM